jgi:hypothetical protein
LTNSASEFSERYLAQVEAEREYVVQQLVEESGKDNILPATSGIGIPLASTMAAMPTLEEAYLSVFAENKRKNPLSSRQSPT